MNDRSNKIMARLQTQMAMQDARIRSDPLPYLQEAHRMVSEAHALLGELEWILGGHTTFDLIMEIAPIMKPIDFNGEALLRISEARKMIREFQA